MIRSELPPPPTKNTDEIYYLPDKYMFMFLQRILPEGTLIAYEKVLIIWKKPRKKAKTKRPDFYILKPNGSEFLLESTTSRKREGKKDPKRLLKKIVRNGAPDKRLIVYYRHNLEAIQRHHPDLIFFQDGRVNTSGIIFDAKRTQYGSRL